MKEGRRGKGRKRTPEKRGKVENASIAINLTFSLRMSPPMGGEGRRGKIYLRKGGGIPAHHHSFLLLHAPGRTGERSRP